MKALRTFAAAVLLATSALAAEKAPMPKDLPAYGPEKPLQAPNVRVSKLDNGLTIWLVSEPGFPKVSFALAVHGGLAADPADRPGISELLSNTIDQGTKTRAAKQIAEEIQASGGEISASSGKDSTTISTGVLSAKADAALTVLADLAQNATFPDSEVILAKRNLIDSLQQRESEPSFLAARAMARVLFADNPYHVTAPTEESVTASTPVELRKIYAQRFRPDQAIMVAVGDFDSDKMLGQLKTKFAAWKAPAEDPLPAPARFTNSLKPTVTFVSRPGSVQTTLELGTFGPAESDPDYAAADVANAIYGGTFGSRLTSNIREDKGYTYSPFAVLRTYRATGVFVTRADVRNEVTAPAFNEMTYELNRMATTSPTPEELATAKRYLVGIEAIRLQVRDGVAGELADLWGEGLPPEQIGIYGQKVAAMTAPEVDAVSKKYYPAARFGIVAVGEEKVVRDAFEPFGLTVEVAH
jgi:predicted Zn-dependent peptidase